MSGSLCAYSAVANGGCLGYYNSSCAAVDGMDGLQLAGKCLLGERGAATNRTRAGHWGWRSPASPLEAEGYAGGGSKQVQRSTSRQPAHGYAAYATTDSVPRSTRRTAPEPEPPWGCKKAVGAKFRRRRFLGLLLPVSSPRAFLPCSLHFCGAEPSRLKISLAKSND